MKSKVLLKFICLSLIGATVFAAAKFYNQSRIDSLDLSRFENIAVSLPSSSNLSEPTLELIVHDLYMKSIAENIQVQAAVVPARKSSKRVSIVKSVKKEEVIVTATPKTILPNEVSNNPRYFHYGFDYVEATPTNWISLLDNNQNLYPAEMEDTKLLAAVEEADPLLSLLDEVSSQVAAVEKNQEEVVANYAGSEDQDLVMIDYSANTEEGVSIQPDLLAMAQPESQNKEVILAAPTQAVPAVKNMISDLTGVEKMSSDVLEVMSRELKKATINSPKVTTQAQKKPVTNQYLAEAKQDKVNQKMSTHTQYTKKNRNSSNQLSFYEVDIQKGKVKKDARGVEFFVETIQHERYTDDGSGKINIDLALNNSSSLLRGTFLSQGRVRTKVELVLEAGNFNYEIPLLGHNELSNFLTEENLEAQGGFLLVQLDSQMDAVEIDANYEAKIFLSKSFKVVEEAEDYDFILFAGVKPGNTMLSYRNFQSQIAEKIVHVVEDELFFEGSLLTKSEEVFFTLKSKNILGKHASDLDLRGAEIVYFNTKNQAVREAVATYSLRTPPRVLGARQFLELKHLNGSIFLGHSGQEVLEVPSQELINYVLEAHQLRTLTNTCMVQLNFSKQISDVMVIGESDRGPISLITSFLDRDGYWSQEATEMASNLFIIGDMAGALSLKVDYVDGTSDALQSFCSLETYLVEQL